MAAIASTRASPPQGMYASHRRHIARGSPARGKLQSLHAGMWVPKPHKAVRIVCGAGRQSDAVTATPPLPKGTSETPQSWNQALFVDPVFRSLALGVAAGAALELGHVLLQVSLLVHASGWSSMIDRWAETSELLRPLMAADHVAAITVWLAFYIFETVAVLRGGKQQTDGSQLRVENAVTLPKRMFPSFKLKLAKSMLSKAAASVSGTKKSSASNVSSPAVDSAVSAFTSRGVLEDLARTGQTARPSAAPSKEERALSRRQKELEDRKKILRNFWYCAATSAEVKPGKPHGVAMLGRSFMLMRGEDGTVHALDDACPHRGAPLSKGWVAQKNGHSCVVCPYHGWAFDKDGKLQEVPSMETGQLPQRPLVDAWPVEEKGGFVWLFFGSKNLPPAERPPIPYCPELDDPTWRPVFGELEFDAPHWPVFENAIDMAHIHYLHDFGNAEKPKITDMQMRREGFGLSGSFSIHNKPVSPLWEWTRSPLVHVSVQALLPSSSIITIELGKGVKMITFVNTVPIDENRSVNRFCLIRNFAGSKQLDFYARRAMFKILREDKVMVEQLMPEQVVAEVSLKPDMPQIAFRKLRQEYMDLGFGVPADIRQQRQMGL